MAHRGDTIFGIAAAGDQRAVAGGLRDAHLHIGLLGETHLRDGGLFAEFIKQNLADALNIAKLANLTDENNRMEAFILNLKNQDKMVSNKESYFKSARIASIRASRARSRRSRSKRWPRTASSAT